MRAEELPISEVLKLANQMIAVNQHIELLLLLEKREIDSLQHVVKLSPDEHYVEDALKKIGVESRIQSLLLGIKKVGDEE